MDRKLLVVEDREDMLKELERWLVRIQLDADDKLVIDFARTKAEAIEKLLRRTYHVAMLDIMLTDLSAADRSGIDILSKIVDSKEGTLSIIMSGTTDHLVPRDANRLGILDYFDKSRDMRHPEEWTAKVKQGLYKSKLALWGHASSLFNYLALPDRKEPFWIVNVAASLGSSIEIAERELELVFGMLVPVLPKKNEQKMVQLETGRLYGEYWSKGLGHAIAVCIHNKNSDPRFPMVDYEKTPIFSREKKSCKTVIWNIDKGAAREEFDDSVFDRRYIPSPEDE